MQNFLLNHGYLAIFVLQLVSSACIPIPSELTLLLGGALCSSGYAASQHGKPLNVVLVIVVGVVGSLIGATIAYIVGITGGRAFIDRWGKYILLGHKDVDRAEAWFTKRGPTALIVGNVVPLIRTFIAFVAGIAEEAKAKFIGFTAIGVTIWVAALVLIGRAVGDQYNRYAKGLAWAGYVVAAVVVIVVVAGLIHRWRSLKHGDAQRGRHAAR